MICSTVVMIVAPPGEPSAMNGLPSARMIVGAIEDLGRLPGPGRFGSAGAGPKVKPVSSLLSSKPRPGTTMPLPPVDSMVRLYATTLPHLSVTSRWVVSGPSDWAVSAVTETGAAGQEGEGPSGSPGGDVCA